ncbi:hypothetical protein PENTCL1PPCAC_11791 [Pristionchus entomophagus]|uniref:Uncharacterized protein n=1 Tax=Pristionchus entomophagus TaxID=358040 RepID=A0AAV5TDG0_9BILA|nr:hypothetical protein PENTCL1PPCAC_11791 [Pristionchus entomophagus]
MMCLVILAALLRLTNEQSISTSSDNSIAMCPCVQTGQSSCQQFDRRYQAHTIEDAMTAFNDLTLDRSSLAPSSVTEDEYCETEDCNNCRLFLQGKLKQVGLMVESPLEPFVTTDLTNKTCSRYRFSTPEGLARKWLRAFYYLLRHEALRYPQVFEKDDRSIDYRLVDQSRSIESQGAFDEEQGESPFSSEESGSSELEEEDELTQLKKKRKKKHSQRHKRQSTASTTTDGSIIGTRYSISCTKRGASTDSSGRISLCSSCWVWRKLPANYAPQYVNELICDTSDTACLSGYATCTVGTHSIDVVRNDSGILTTVALTAGAYCECKANANSAIQTLVSGTGLKGAVSPVGNGTTQG